MPLLAPQAFGEAWPLSMTSWLYLAFSPSSLASPSIQDVLTSNGIDLSRLDQSVANLTYYTSAQFIADVGGKQTAWSGVCACAWESSWWGRRAERHYFITLFLSFRHVSCMFQSAQPVKDA